MRITEKQLQLMLYWLTLFSSNENIRVSADGRVRLCRLVNEIVKQQSEETKEIKDE